MTPEEHYAKLHVGDEKIEASRPSAEISEKNNLEHLLKAGVVDITYGIPGVYSGELLFKIASRSRLVIIGYDKKVYMGVNSSVDQHEKLLQQIEEKVQHYHFDKVDFATALEFDERTGSDYLEIETETGKEKLYIQRQPGTLRLAKKGFNAKAEASLGRILSKLKGTTVSWMTASVA